MKSFEQALQGKIGLGTGPLGSLFRDVSEEDAQATIQAAWDQGIRYFDTAPQYGSGLSEIRLGNALSQYNRDDYVISTKVGRVISDEEEEKEGLYKDGLKNKVISDYTEDATLRSIEQSLERLKTDRLDIVYVHDISPDYFGDEWISKFDEARKGAFRVLTRLREEGVIRSWGLAVNTTTPIEIAMELEETHPDSCLAATQYTLMQHERALERMMPTAQEKRVGIVAASAYNSGALLGGSYFDYAKASPEILSQVERLQEIANRHNVDLKSAALQFSTAHPAVSAVVTGSSKPSRIKEDLAAMKAEIPNAFWQELLENKLISEKAPIPNAN